MTKAISTAKLVEMLKKHDKSVVSDLLKQVDLASALSKKGSNVELRKKAVLQSLEQNNDLALAELSDALDALIPLGQELTKQADEIIAQGLDEEQVVTAMNLYLKVKMSIEGADAMKDMIRNMVFSSMDKAAAELGEEFPEATNMVMDVPELGKRFCREGAGRKEAEFDIDKLRAVVGDELFDKITVAKVTYKVDESALSAAILANPGLMEELRDAIKPGDWKSPRLMVRDIPANEEE